MNRLLICFGAVLAMTLVTSQAVSADTADEDLLRMREEEKLAHDVYVKLAETHKLRIFQNISGAEDRHVQAIERLTGSKGANGNSWNNTPGVFTFPEYQELYDSLVASGTRSTLDALKVGAKIEEMDIADLKQLLTQTTDPRVRQVLENLMQGSHSHLRAFASQLAMRGASYHAEFLSQEEFDRIANDSQRGGRRARRGRGR